MSYKVIMKLLAKSYPWFLRGRTYRYVHCTYIYLQVVKTYLEQTRSYGKTAIRSLWKLCREKEVTSVFCLFYDVCHCIMP